MKRRRQSVRQVMAVGALAMLAVTPVGAHPPDNPYDDTIFAPIATGGGFPIDLKPVASGLTAPLKGVLAPCEPGRIYVVDQPGKLWAIDLKTGQKTLFLDVSSRLVPLGVAGPGSFDERGFLGVAFHPQYQKNGKFYTYTSEPFTGATPTFPTTLPPGTSPDHQNVVLQWRANSPGHPAAGATLVDEVMRVDWPQFNHDGGDINFGPDGKLYIPMGDGGGADDEDGDQSINPPPGVVGHPGPGNGQNLAVPLGKILRIDVDGHNSSNGKYGIPGDNPFVNTPGAVKEIWAYGFRNPYRISFDQGSGRLIAGDVGQNDIEEVDLIVKGGNYGWRHKEGTLCFDGRGAAPGVATTVCPPLPANLIDPIAQYDTHHEGHSVIGGFVYRGRDIPQLRGRYVFGEFSRLFTFPLGPDNYGRLLYLQEKEIQGAGLRTIREFQGFPEAAARLGLTDLTRPAAAFEQTLSVMGMAQDASGEIYLLGNLTGRPVGEDGVVLKLAPRKQEPPATIHLPPGFQPEGIDTGRGSTLYVTSFNDGAVFAVDARTGVGSVLVPPQTDRAGIGIKFDARTDHLFVAGGPSGHALVHNARTGALVADLNLASAMPSFINDVVLTRDAAYFTDSFQPVLYKVRLGPGGRLTGAGGIKTIALTGDWVQVPGEFNANGIEELPGSDQLLVINSKTGVLYKVDPRTGRARAVDMGDDSLANGDGLVLRGRTLYVVQNFTNQIAVVELSRRFDRGEIVRFITDSRFDFPATAAKLGDALYVANLRITTPHTPTTPYTVVRVPIGH